MSCSCLTRRLWRAIEAPSSCLRVRIWRSGSAALRLCVETASSANFHRYSPQPGSSVSSDVMLRRVSAGRRMRNPRTSTLWPLYVSGLYAADTRSRYVLGPSGHCFRGFYFARRGLRVACACRIGRVGQHPCAIRRVGAKASNDAHEREIGHRLGTVFADELNPRQIFNTQLLGARRELIRFQQVADDVDIGLVAERRRRAARHRRFCFVEKDIEARLAVLLHEPRAP